ncbi:hypothetical protein AAHA92_17315 [Salvia divinorum]|uniref:Uncharacterized protein n=1 Tax=Salvia divinorum TaxID=28513 RepID=A0ABD1GYW7_SALDI
MSLYLLFLVSCLAIHETSKGEARTIPFRLQQGDMRTFATLGVVCKCCEGGGESCTSSWKGSCSKLHCLPWKF